MSDVLKNLIEERDKASDAYETWISSKMDALKTEKRDFSDEEKEERTQLRSAFTVLDERIDEVKADEERKAKVDEARKASGLTFNASASVGNEAKVYEYDNRGRSVTGNSFVLDLLNASQPASGSFDEARQRLSQFGYQQAVEARNKSAEGQKILTQMRETFRGDDNARSKVERFEQRGNAGSDNGMELRIGTTTTIAGFTTPVYFVDQFLEYRLPGRPFADSLVHMDLPDYGLTVYRPYFTGAPTAQVQSSEGSALTDSPPTSAMLSASLSTVYSQATVSIQFLERSQLRDMDRVILQSMAKAYAQKIDNLALTAALTGATAVSYVDTAGFHLVSTPTSTAGTFWSHVAQAKAGIETAAGALGNPTRLFLQPMRWEYMVGTAFDTTNRPLLVEQKNGPMNAVASGVDNTNHEGYTGYTFNGLDVYKDLNIPAGSTNDQAVILDPSEIWLFENVPTPRILPQTNAANLEIILQLYGYAAGLVGYPAHVASINGSGMSAFNWLT